MKQRILDADTKNSVGLAGLFFQNLTVFFSKILLFYFSFFLGPIEEISHNALAVYWNPFESAAKVSSFCIVRYYPHSAVFPA